MSWCHSRVPREILQKALANPFHVTTQQISFPCIRSLLVLLSCRGFTAHEREFLGGVNLGPRNGADVERGAVEIHALVRRSDGVGSGAMRVARLRYFAAVLASSLQPRQVVPLVGRHGLDP